jgi:MFS family permease
MPDTNLVDEVFGSEYDAYRKIPFKSRSAHRMEKMNDQPSKRVLLFVVLTIGSLTFGVAAATPALAEIAKAFPEVSSQTIQMVVTVPSLLIMVSTLVCGVLSRSIGKKRLVIIGMLLFGIGGITPAFYGGIAFILIMRGVFGVGVGFLLPLSQALVADYFEGRDRDVFMGYSSSNAAIFGIVFTLLGGFLCDIYWRYTFYAHLLVVPAFLIVLAKMPEPPKQRVAESLKPAGLTMRSWVFISAYFVYNIVMFCFITDLAFVISADKVGNAGTAGVVMTFSSVGGIFAGIILGWVTKVFRNYALVFALMFLAVGSILLLFVQSAPMFMLAYAFWGLGFGTFNPLIILEVMGSVAKSATAFALAVLTSAMGIGQFISPMFYSLIRNLFGFEGSRSSWIVAASCFAAAVLVLPIFITLRLRQRQLSVAG